MVQKPICHINLSHGYRGSERQTETLIRGIHNWNVSQRAVVLEGEPLAINLAELKGLELITVPASVSAAAKAAKGCRFVHAHDDLGIVAARRARFFSGIPYIVTVRDAGTPKKSWSVRRRLRKASAIVALSSAIRKVLQKYDKHLDPVVINSCASVFKIFPGTSEILQSRYAGKFVVGHVGTLDDASKGQRDLIEVARTMARKYEDVHFLFVGSGPDEMSLKSEAANLENVEFVGQVQNIGDYLKIMSVFAFPSRQEGFGSTLLDAMDYSLPLIATAVGGIPEIVQDGVNGLLINAGNTDQLAFAIQRLRTDSKLRKRLGANGHSFVQKFTPDAMVEQYLDVYQQYFP